MCQASLTLGQLLDLFHPVKISISYGIYNDSKTERKLKPVYCGYLVDFRQYYDAFIDGLLSERVEEATISKDEISVILAD